MRIRFLTDVFPQPATDNEYYKRGAVADLRKAETLIQLGYAEALDASESPQTPTSTAGVETPQGVPVTSVTLASEAQSEPTEQEPPQPKAKRTPRRRKA